MTPDERNLIMGLFDRMRAQGAVEKEYEAEQLINTEVRRIPDSAYMLVQSVLVGEQTLAQAADRIGQLEQRVRDLEAAAQRGAAQPSSGGFLGGLFGGGSKPAQPTSVPPSRAPAASPWGQPAQPQYQPPQQGGYAPQPGYAPQAAPARAGGGFMAQAMTTAAGVAGGMLAANAISGMLGGHHGHANSSSANAGYDPTNQASTDAAQDAAQDQEYAGQADDNDPGTTYSSDDSGGSWGGSDSSDA